MKEESMKELKKEEIKGQFKWEFAKLKNFIYEIKDELYCIGEGVCKKYAKDKKVYLEYKNLIQNIDNKKNYRDIEKFHQLFNVLEDLLYNAKDEDGIDEMNKICELICDDDNILRCLSEQKKHFLRALKFNTEYNIDLYIKSNKT